jgi:hypothetical protein
VGTFSFALFATAICLLAAVHGVWLLALAFALAYGWANGLMTIVRGTVPGVLFGGRDYGALLGRLAQPQFILKSLAPVAVTLLSAIDDSSRGELFVIAACSVLALARYRMAITRR